MSRSRCGLYSLCARVGEDGLTFGVDGGDHLKEMGYHVENFGNPDVKQFWLMR